MPIETHTHWLLEGREAWNNRRSSQGIRPYFSFENIFEEFRDAGKLNHNGRVCLSSYDLSDATFHGTRLNRVDFLHADLRRARFRGVSFADTNFRQADLTDAEFGVSYLGGVDFSSATLENTELVQPNLSGADLNQYQGGMCISGVLKTTERTPRRLISPCRSQMGGHRQCGPAICTFHPGFSLGWSRFWQAKLFPDTHRSPSSRIHRIKNVAELIEICFEIKNRFDGLEIYFRGERDRSWCLRPSVMRPSKDGTFKLRRNEGEMLRGLIAKRPEDFLGMNSALEQMVVAQHHGLKTRLVDVSPNPCVALFTACDERDPAGNKHPNDMAGRIHVFAVPKGLIKSFDSDTISIIANFAKLDRGYQALLLGKTGDDSVSEDPKSQIQNLYDEALRRLYHYIRQEKPQFEKLIDPRHLLQVFLVEPKQSFERIRAQEGAFLLSAFHERFERELVMERVKNVPVYEHETIIVPAKAKAHLLKELSLLSFTRENLYPSLDEVADRITQPFL